MATEPKLVASSIRKRSPLSGGSRAPQSTAGGGRGGGRGEGRGGRGEGGRRGGRGRGEGGGGEEGGRGEASIAYVTQPAHVVV